MGIPSSKTRNVTMLKHYLRHSKKLTMTSRILGNKTNETQLEYVKSVGNKIISTNRLITKQSKPKDGKVKDVTSITKHFGFQK